MNTHFFGMQGLGMPQGVSSSTAENQEKQNQKEKSGSDLEDRQILQNRFKIDI